MMKILPKRGAAAGPTFKGVADELDAYSTGTPQQVQDFGVDDGPLDDIAEVAHGRLRALILTIYLKLRFRWIYLRIK